MTKMPRTNGRRVRASIGWVIAVVIAAATLAGCGGSTDTQTIAGGEINLDDVVRCLIKQGWTETSKETGSAGTSYGMETPSGVVVTASLTATDQDVPTDSSTSIVVASPAGDSGDLLLEASEGSFQEQDKTVASTCVH